MDVESSYDGHWDLLWLLPCTGASQRDAPERRGSRYMPSIRSRSPDRSVHVRPSRSRQFDPKAPGQSRDGSDRDREPDTRILTECHMGEATETNET
jgi:hypothetical protein